MHDICDFTSVSGRFKWFERLKVESGNTNASIAPNFGRAHNEVEER